MKKAFVFALVCLSIGPAVRAQAASMDYGNSYNIGEALSPSASSHVVVNARQVTEPTDRNAYHELRLYCGALPVQVQARLDHYSSEHQRPISQFSATSRLRELHRGHFNRFYGLKCQLDVFSHDMRYLISGRKSERFRSELACQSRYSELEQDGEKVVYQRYHHGRGGFLGLGAKFCQVDWLEIVPGR